MSDNQTKISLAGEVPNVLPVKEKIEEIDKSEAEDLLEQLEDIKESLPTNHLTASNQIQNKNSKNIMSRLVENLKTSFGFGTSMPTIAQKDNVKAIPAVPPKETAQKKVNHHYLRKLFTLVFVLVSLCLGSYLILFMTNIDTQIIGLTVSGKIIDQNVNKPVSDAVIYVNGIEAGRSDKDGNYNLSGLPNTQFEFKVTAVDFSDFVETLAIPRQVLNYSLKKDVFIIPSKTVGLKGKFVADNPSYKFLLDKLYINDKEYQINQDGSFDLPAVPIGEVVLNLKSIEFKDIEKTLNLIEGENQLEAITLVPSGDIIGELKS